MYNNSLPTTAGLGAVNDHILGHIMRDAVIRGMDAIRQARFEHVISVKGSMPDGRPDIVTNADVAAQARIKKKLEQCFPDFGLIGEEAELRKDCKLDGVDAFFTIDPLDGTQAFARLQSHGFGPMISLVIDGRVVGVCIGDAMTEELYYYRPNSRHVHRLHHNEPASTLHIDEHKSLSEQFVLLRSAPDYHSPFVQELIRPRDHGGHFYGMNITNGSIGLSTARLWKGEVGMQVLLPSKLTPWDSNPIIGISLMLGFVFLRVEADGQLTPFEPTPVKEIGRWDFETIIVHQSNLAALQAWAKKCA